jgi:hypothetical protein
MIATHEVAVWDIPWCGDRVQSKLHMSNHTTAKMQSLAIAHLDVV